MASDYSEKLYDSPDAEVNSGCDVYTRLTIRKNDETNTIKAVLVNRLLGACQLYVEPNQRSYEVTERRDRCGTYVYEDEQETIRILNHSARVCDDKPVARIMVTELRDGGGATRLYSLD